MKTLILYRHTEDPSKGRHSIVRERESDVEVRIEYDETAPCWMCGLPVGEASMGGTVICPACDCGVHRGGRPWTFGDTERAFARYRENQERAERGSPAIADPLFT